MTIERALRQKEQPDEPGWWAFEGYVNYAKPPVPNRTIQEVVRVYFGRTTGRLCVERAKGYHPAYMLIGKWWRLHLPWEQRAA